MGVGSRTSKSSKKGTRAVRVIAGRTADSGASDVNNTGVVTVLVVV